MRQWVTKQCHADLQQVADRYHISPVFAEVLVKRGLYSWKEMDAYLFEDMAQMHAPEQMTGLVQAADILFDKIQQNEKIRVIGDYDVDGVMSTYILCRGLEGLGAKVSYTIPHRERDGYGMRAYMAENAYEEGARTIVTCDNGISAKDAVARAKELGMTVVLTDHHEVPTEQEVEILPDADVIVDPKQSKETYPFHELCGAGVAYKLMQYMYEKKGISKQVEELLPFAAIATVCDVVPLQEENRLLVRRGLEALPTTSNIGLQALLQQLQFEKKVTSMDLGFRVGPCINAPGRLVDATISLELFLEKDPAAARTKATKLVELNEERKDITRIATEQAVKEIERGEIPRVLVVYLPDCHESVAGIVAGR
ncbi:MAG: DHH family phosphoesterase, partial [Lachnospiraceae bacterium]|nr:DHH family phosphoesterase [Lachnospiraceae bacterium]